MIAFPETRWGKFGQEDRIGALNFIGAEQIMSATSLVKRGQVVPLNRALDEKPAAVFGRPSFKRSARLHNQLRPFCDCHLVINDDNVEFAVQGGSHWDSFAHFGVIESGHAGVFYGGAGIQETLPSPSAKRLGIDAFNRGIVGRGVLLDVVAAIAGDNADTLPEGYRITDDDIRKCLTRQKIDLSKGDIVLVYTGFENRYPMMEKAGSGEFSRVAGLDGSTLPLWRDHQISALVSDNLAVDALPTDQSMHIGALRNLGIPLGELWLLRELTNACRADADHTFLLVSVPLNIPGGFGSPANAVALR